MELLLIRRNRIKIDCGDCSSDALLSPTLSSCSLWAAEGRARSKYSWGDFHLQNLS